MIEVRQQGDIAIVTMAHGKANAMNTAFCRALKARLDELRAAPAAAVIITGRGTIFSAGIDLLALALAEGGASYVREFLPALNAMLETVFGYPKPVIAAVNGHAIAGGCVLACAVDRRLMAAETGRVGVTELLVGVPFPACAMEIMRRAVAPQVFEEVIFGAATYAPPDALARGLIDEVVEGGVLMDRAVTAAKALAALSPEAFAITKRQTRQPAMERLARDGARIDAEAMQIWSADDTLARVRDYVARTLKKA
jgi:enoyl-CoA hydratase